MPAEKLLEVSDLSIKVDMAGDGISVLDEVSFSLDAGQTLGIVGESGCGKSMTALALMQLLPAGFGISSGSIKLAGKNLLELGESELQNLRGNDISMIFQEPMTSLNPVYTVGDQVAEVLRLHQGLSAAQARKEAIDMLAAVHITAPDQRIDEYPHQLSGGMRQRVMIAMALACQPRVLIADEPTTALDVTVQAQIFSLLKQLQKERGTAIILITHDLGAVAELADEVSVFYAGKCVEHGPVSEILTRPQHPYTRGLISCIPRLRLGQAAHEPRSPLQEIQGMVPALGRFGAGCRFAPRCSLADPHCHAEAPPRVSLAQPHAVECWKV